MTFWIAYAKQLDGRYHEILDSWGIQHFLGRNARLIAYLFLVAILAYGFSLFQFFLTLDAEFHANSFGPKLAWVTQDRWGMYLLNAILLPDPVMPFIPMLLAIIGLVVGTLCVLHALSDERGMADYLAAPIAMACPVLYFALYFNTFNYGIGMGIGLVGMGLLALSRWSWQGSVATVLSWGFAIGIYQAMAPLIATLFGFYVFARIIGKENTWDAGVWLKKAAVFTLVFGLALLLHKALSRFMLITVDRENSGYLSIFVQATWEPSYWLSAFRRTGSLALHYFTGSSQFYLYDLLSLKILFCFSVVTSGFLLMLANHRDLMTKTMAVAALSAAVLASVSINLIGNNLPPRTMLAVPWVLAGLVFVVARNSGHVARSLLMLMVIACFYNFAVVNNRYAFSSYMQWKADREMAVLLLDRMGRLWSQLPMKSPHQRYPVVMVGMQEANDSPIFINRNMIGMSFLRFSGGNTRRLVGFFDTLGVDDYRSASPHEEAVVAEYANSMPVWPREGSIDVVNDVLVIKLSDHTWSQKKRICAQAPSHSLCTH